MAQTDGQSRDDAAFAEASRCDTVVTETAEIRRILVETETPASAPSSSPTPRNPANKLWTKTSQRKAYIQHLTNWASNHDSSTYFHGSISLHPQGTFPREVVQLGKSVNCLLTDVSSGDTPKNIVIRLFQSQRHDGSAQQRKGRGRKDPDEPSDTASWNSTSVSCKGNHRARLPTRNGHSIAPYQLVIRSGSSWVPARQYLNNHYFAHHAKPEKEVASHQPASTSSNTNAQRPAWVNLTANNVNWAINTPPASAVLTTNTQPPAWASLTANNLSFSNLNFNNTNRIAEVTRSEQPDQEASRPAHSRHAGPLSSAKDTVKISPLFHPFLRLPQELQDEILYQAVGYTRVISLTHSVHVMHASSSSESPITISKLFRLSKMISEHMTTHIFRSTNFHFGITGFTRFLWQLGPVNRSNLQHLTFHFGKASLLHCIRWLAPDPIWELFEPPVVTSPSTLTLFWRCQLQDLMKEVSLSTLTIDIRDVPVGDVPMLVRILKTAIGRVERMRVIGNHVRTGVLIEEYAQDLHTWLGGMQEPTWRELSLRYHTEYNHQRWHMRHIWALHGLDIRPLLDAWMDKDKAFFDS
ncbi:hypothetical protein BU25DRAFT_405912 [Macroventuria anomochaeta]|uniref:Uncharacterized protein n=1 Tax=Macroventuria anomochaeta TaxID=301207 RepID=A0ACB6SE70_9PLEO|nr:uncharacterized protein BU25DRAFT_405912 [Macroventuria anomochaeta]KAF2632585.1 hypothetical protein BU25DRAFT_405912 [Macroventuria anomochaeta]